MSRDLFADTFARRPASPRSKWTLVGSLLAHVGVISVLLIVPVVSALDTFVFRANDTRLFALPATVMPAPPPPSAAKAIAPNISVTAAPVSPPGQPVTAEVTLPTSGGGAGVPGAIGLTASVGIPGLAGGSGAVALASPPPTPAGPVRPGGDIKPPLRVAYLAPIYPTIAKAARIDGTVILEATIDASGIVRDARVLRSIPLLDGAAIAAVSQWRYTPTRLNGVAVPIILTVTVTFQLR